MHVAHGYYGFLWNTYVWSMISNCLFGYRVNKIQTKATSPPTTYVARLLHATEIIYIYIFVVTPWLQRVEGVVAICDRLRICPSVYMS